MSRVQVFNRRRAGESERLELADMKNLHSISADDEDYKNLTADEQKAAQEYVRIVIRGKLNKNVPILLTKSWYKAIKLIIRHRHNAGVSKRNPYVFGLDGLSDQSFLSATKLLNEFSKKCGADKPETLRGTPLRKHAATKCAQFGLDEANTANFAKFMGHDINIHKNVYRQPVVKTDILGISKVLERAQKPVEVSTMNDMLKENTNKLKNNIGFAKKKNFKADDSQSDVFNDTTAHDTTVNTSRQSSNSNASTSYQRTFSLKNRKELSSAILKQPIVSKTPWTEDEVKTVIHHFSEYLHEKKLPPIPTIRNVQSKFKVLQNRTPTVIKAWINN